MTKTIPTKLLQEIQFLRHDRAFNCLTRPALEWDWINGLENNAAYIVFCDIDQMHDANQRHGYEAVNGKIRRAIHARRGDVVAARWYSGDELVWVVKKGNRCGSPRNFCDRLVKAFTKEGLAATFAYCMNDPAVWTITEIVDPLSDAVLRAKRDGRRGEIVEVKGKHFDM